THEGNVSFDARHSVAILPHGAARAELGRAEVVLALAEDDAAGGKLTDDKLVAARLLPEKLRRRDPLAGKEPPRERPHGGGAGVPRGPRHRGGCTSAIEAIEEIEPAAHRSTLAHTLDFNPHDGEVLVSIAQLPEGEQQPRCEIDRPHSDPPHIHVRLAKEAALAQHPDLLDV